MPGKQMIFSSLIAFLTLVEVFLSPNYCLALDDTGITAIFEGDDIAVVSSCFNDSTCDNDSSSTVVTIRYEGTSDDCHAEHYYITYHAEFTFYFDPEIFSLRSNDIYGDAYINPGEVVEMGLCEEEASPDDERCGRQFKITLKLDPADMTESQLASTVTCDVYKYRECATYPPLVGYDASVTETEIGEIGISFGTCPGGSGGGGSGWGSHGGSGFGTFGGGGCSTCPSGDSSGGGSLIGFGGYKIRNEMEDTLSLSSSVYLNDSTYQPNINYGGVMIKPDLMANWSTSGVKYDSTGYEVTRVWYDMTDSTGHKYLFYLDGSWDSGDNDLDKSKRLACEDIMARGNVMKLDYVIDTVNNLTKHSYTYGTPTTSGDYDYMDITVDVGDGTNNRYVVYQMKKLTVENEYKLARIWMGDDPANDMPDLYDVDPTPDPDECRWVDIETEFHTQSGVPVITESGCSSCVASRMGYEYAAGSYTRSDGYPTRHLVTKVKSIDSSQVETVLASYDYDSRDRLTKHWLGDKDSGGKLASNIIYSDTTRLQKEYIDASQYRATVFLNDHYGRITEKRQYHDLQTSAEPSGTFSRTLYRTETDSYDNLTKEITYLPKGNTVIKEYGTSGTNDGRTIKRQRNSVVEAEYDYTTVTDVVSVDKHNNLPNANAKVTN